MTCCFWVKLHTPFVELWFLFWFPFQNCGWSLEPLLASRQILLKVNIHASEVGYGEREGYCPSKGLLIEPSKLSLLFQITASQETRSQLKIAGSSGFTLFMSPRINFAHYNTKFSTQRLSCLPECVCVVCALSHVCVCVRGRYRIVIIISIHFCGCGCDYCCAAASDWSSQDSLQGSMLSFHHDGLGTLTRFLRLGSKSLSTTEPSLPLFRTGYMSSIWVFSGSCSILNVMMYFSNLRVYIFLQ